jgi:hypothetical protein
MENTFAKDGTDWHSTSRLWISSIWWTRHTEAKKVEGDVTTLEVGVDESPNPWSNDDDVTSGNILRFEFSRKLILRSSRMWGRLVGRQESTFRKNMLPPFSGYTWRWGGGEQVFVSPAEKIPRHYPKLYQDRFLPHLTNSPFTYNSTIIRYIVSYCYHG